jgi:lactate dehydrogenase-like 2-hydroxyacid dehydrogenase
MTTKPRILQLGPYPAWDQEALDAAFTVHRLFEADDKAALLEEVGPHVRAIATKGDLGASRAIIESCPRLEIISVYGVGYDAVDLETCRARGIRLTNTPDVLTGDVADLAVGMMLAQSRGIVPAERWVRNGDWVAKGGFPLRQRVWGRRAGILGLGRIGFAIARRLEGFDMEVAYASRSAKPEADALGFTHVPDAVELARRSDVLFVALAASPETRHAVNAEVLAALGPQGMLVNISRGSNVDEEALIDALASGRLGSAALDVYENEPRIDPRFLGLDNVLLQPHHGSATVDTRKAMGQLMRDNLLAHFAGEPLLTPVL